MKQRVYKVKTEGSDKLAQLLPNAYYSIFDRAEHTAKAQIEEFMKWKAENSSEELVHFVEREDNITGYRAQLVYSFKEWYHVIMVRVEPTWIIIKEE